MGQTTSAGIPIILRQRRPAINVLGKASFTTATSTTNQSGMENPEGVALDTSASRLFIAATNTYRAV
jgi:hypothetical protein